MTQAPSATPGLVGIDDLRGFLLGAWRLARVIEDRRTGRNGTLRGQAAFTARPGGLGYLETGELRLGAHEGPARQSHLYDFPRPGRAQIRFADGRPFHDLDLSAGRWTCLHRCGADLYRGSFEVRDPELMCVRWAVFGPRKDYVSLSRYRRAAAPRVGPGA